MTAMGQKRKSKLSRPCPGLLFPQQRTSAMTAGTSVSCQYRTHAPQQTAALFDHLAGERDSRYPRALPCFSLLLFQVRAA